MLQQREPAKNWKQGERNVGEGKKRGRQIIINNQLEIWNKCGEKYLEGREKTWESKKRGEGKK